MNGQIEVTVNEVEEYQPTEEERTRGAILEDFQAELAGRKFTDREMRVILRLMWIVNNTRAQTLHIEEYEAGRIRALREGHPPTSYGDLAYIFNRSKSTIYNLLITPDNWTNKRL